MKNIFIVLILISTLLAGCIPLSVNPVYTESTKIYEPALVGAWINAQNGDTYIFTRSSSDDMGFKLICIEARGNVGHFNIFLADIGGTIVLDSYPDPEYADIDESSLSSMHKIPFHSFFIVEQFEPALILNPFDTGWLATYVVNNPESVSPESGPILTATPDELQEFLRIIVQEENAFTDPWELTRIE